MADFTPTDLITLSKALEYYERHAEPSLLPPQRELMQTRATLLHQMNVASMAICERLTGGDDLLKPGPPLEDQKTLYQLLTGLEHCGDLVPHFQDDGGGLFCREVAWSVRATEIVTRWYLDNRELQHEVLSEALHGKESRLGGTLMDTHSAGCIVVDALMDKAMEYAQADPAWEKLIQDITERERS